jgi:mannitol/fructose-specific phosphotransferase system IIA component (Ntr-type)
MWQPGFECAQDIAKELQVSANAIYGCLEDVSMWLSVRRLDLVRCPGLGLGIRGSEIHVRQAMAEALWERSDYRLVPRMPGLKRGEKQVTSIRVMLDEVLRSAGRRYLTHAVESLAVHIFVGSYRVGHGHPIVLQRGLIDQLKLEEEWPTALEIAQRVEAILDVSLSEQERSYVAFRLRTTLPGGEEPAPTSAVGVSRDAFAVDAAYWITEEASEACDIDLGGVHSLIEDLSALLRTFLYRLKFGLHLTNSYLGDIKLNWSPAFQSTVRACRLVERIFGVKMSEEDIGCIALYVVAALEKVSAGARARRKALLVCPDRVSLMRVLEARIASEFPDIDIVGAVAAPDLNENCWELHPDFVVSPYPLDGAPVPTILVHPLLPREEAFKMRRFVDSLHPAMIMGISRDPNRQNRLSTFGRSLVGVVRIHAVDREDAIRQACSILASKNLITPRFVDAVLKNAGEFGCYTVAGPGLSLPHAGPLDGVDESFCLVVVLEKPLKFGRKAFDPVRRMVMWGATTEKQYKAYLHDTLCLIRNRSRLTDLLSAENLQDIQTALADRPSKLS